MGKELSGLREPRVGDRVYDDTYEQWGVVSRGVYEFVGDEEQFTDVLVDFKVLHVWYTPDEMRHHWDEQRQAFIIP